MKGDIRQFPTKVTRIAAMRSAPEGEALWPDGKPRSQDNAFNWRTGEPSAFSATSQAERQRKAKEDKQKEKS